MQEWLSILVLPWNFFSTCKKTPWNTKVEIFIAGNRPDSLWKYCCRAILEADVTDRWLAAQEVFNVIQQKKLWTSYAGATGGLKFSLDGKMYSGFKFTCADGWMETWALTANSQYSSMKLLDQPLPDSLKPSRASGCMS